MKEGEHLQQLNRILGFSPFFLDLRPRFVRQSLKVDLKTRIHIDVYLVASKEAFCLSVADSLSLYFMIV